MKKILIMTLFYIVAELLCPITMSAQNKYVKLTSGEELYGKVKKQEDGNLQITIQEDNSVVYLQPSEIVSISRPPIKTKTIFDMGGCLGYNNSSNAGYNYNFYGISLWYGYQFNNSYYALLGVSSETGNITKKEAEARAAASTESEAPNSDTYSIHLRNGYRIGIFAAGISAGTIVGKWNMPRYVLEPYVQCNLGICVVDLGYRYSSFYSGWTLRLSWSNIF